MKNTITITVPIILGFILSSCGTTTRYASSGYEDAIYQKPSTNGYIVVNTENDSKIELLKGKTKESNRVIINGKVVEAAYVDENGNVNINLDDHQEKTYLILNPGESFEERLTKFENPQYQINITYSYMDFYDPWFWDFGYNRYYWHMGRMGRMALRNPWYSYFMSPWFGGGFYGYNQYFMDPFAGINYFWWDRYSMIRSPWHSYYSSWYYPGESYGYWYYNWNDPDRYRYTSSRDFYYGRRESARSNTTPGSRAVVSGGSYTRQATRVEQVRGDRFYTGDISSSESQYRRDSRFEGYGSSTNNQAREVSGQRRGNTEANSRVERESSVRRGSEISRGTEVNRGSNNTQSSVRRSNNEGVRSSGTVNRGTSTVNRSSSAVNRSSSTVNRSSGSSTTGTSATRGSSQRRDDVISSGNYRPSENQRSNSTSNNNTFTRGSSSNSNSGFYNNNSASRSSVSTPPASSSGSSSSANTSSSSSAGSSSNTGSSGSSYRR